jgi:hypothetical protein
VTRTEKVTEKVSGTFSASVVAIRFAGSSAKTPPALRCSGDPDGVQD